MASFGLDLFYFSCGGCGGCVGPLRLWRVAIVVGRLSLFFSRYHSLPLSAAGPSQVLWSRTEKEDGWQTMPLMARVLPWAALWMVLLQPLVDPEGLLAYSWTPRAAPLVLLRGSSVARLIYLPPPPPELFLSLSFSALIKFLPCPITGRGRRRGLLCKLQRLSSVGPLQPAGPRGVGPGQERGLHPRGVRLLRPAADHQGPRRVGTRGGQQRGLRLREPPEVRGGDWQGNA